MTELTRPRRRWGRRIVVITIAMVLVLFLVRAAADVWTGQRVAGVESRLEQRFGSLDETSGAPASVAPEENRARAFRAALPLLNYQGEVGRGRLRGEVHRFVAMRSPTPVPSELRAFVASNSAALQMADDARRRDQSNWEVDLTTGTNVPSLMDVRTLSDAIYLAVRAGLEDGEADTAALSSASGLALSASLRQEPSLITQLIRMAVGSQHFEGIQRLMTTAEPSKASLEELAARLAENRTPDPMQVGLLAELRHFNSVMRRLEDGELPANGTVADLIPGTVARMTDARNSPLWMGPLARLTRPLTRMGRIHYLEQMEKLLLIQAGALPRSALPIAPAHWSPFRWLDSSTISGLVRAMESNDMFGTQLSVTELAVALRRYRVDHSQYPDTLAGLVPAYVAVMPMDPITGKPPAYERQGAGFRLHAEKGTNTSPYQAAVLVWQVPK